MEEMIQLSVIIPTRNRASLLLATLKSIEQSTLDQSFFEVLICDNNSTDNTAEVAVSFATKFRNFRYFKTIEPGLHVGRNKGFKESQANILVYIDDDIEAFPEWLETINEVFKNKDVVLVGGKDLPRWEINPPDWVLEMWKPNLDGDRILGSFSILDFGNDVKEINPFYVFGCNFSVRKDIIRETKGFHPDGMPQEIIELRGDGESYVSNYILQKGYKTIYHPNASVYHFVSKERLNINYLRKRAFNQGISDSYTSIRDQRFASQKKSITFDSFIKKVLRHIKKLFKDNTNVALGDVNIYQIAMEEGHKEGYNFHKQRVKVSPELEAWVIKDNYL